MQICLYPRALMTLRVAQLSLKIAHFSFFIMAPATAGCYIQKREKKLCTQISYSPSDKVTSKLPQLHLDVLTGFTTVNNCSQTHLYALFNRISSKQGNITQWKSGSTVLRNL